jgi:hypothetical protein
VEVDPVLMKRFVELLISLLLGFAHKVGHIPKMLDECSPYNSISSTDFDFMGKAEFM